MMAAQGVTDSARWPAAMRCTTAASYLDLSVAEFEREVAAGRMPAPIMLGKAEHWVRTAIDERLGDMIGATKRDWRKDQPLYQQASEREVAPPPLDEASQRLTVAKLATRWGISDEQVRLLYRTGKIRGFRIGKLIRFRPVDSLEDEKRLGFS